ncbi:MAG: serine/threonine protein kinase, partial [Oscillospiraceae bacterium]|nr:serine/threonine protein kinase [Oscillospiraceae bacterium]
MAMRCLGCMEMKENSPVCEHCGFHEETKNSDHQLPPGTVVGGQYILGKVLGQGGFGITYLGWDRVMNQRVAVKEYFPKGYASRSLGNTRVTNYDGQNSQDFAYNKQRFLREAESLSKLWDIPQIVKILRCFEENGTAYIAMEYAPGINLRDHLKQLGRPMTMNEVLSLLGPIITALSSVHQANLVHRDISPDNIMVLPDGTTKLLDFGAARYVENADAEKERQTSTQAVLKDGFAPPEQYQ